VSDTECPQRWKHYCGAVYDGIHFALSRGKKVVVATQPYVPGNHREQQEALRSMLRTRFSGNANVRYANFGDLINVMDDNVCFDHMHLNVAGNRIVARHLVQPLAELMPDAFNRPLEAQ